MLKFEVGEWTQDFCATLSMRCVGFGYAGQQQNVKLFLSSYSRAFGAPMPLENYQ
jgi:hypothetical protein